MPTSALVPARADGVWPEHGTAALNFDRVHYTTSGLTTSISHVISIVARTTSEYVIKSHVRFIDRASKPPRANDQLQRYLLMHVYAIYAD